MAKRWRKDGKNVTSKTLEKYDKILSYMKPDIWYRASDFEEVVGVKVSRIKVLLTEMEQQNLIESAGRTKGKMYRRKVIRDYSWE